MTKIKFKITRDCRTGWSIIIDSLPYYDWEWIENWTDDDVRKMAMVIVYRNNFGHGYFNRNQIKT